MNTKAAQTMPPLIDRVRECHAAWAAYNAVAPGEDRAAGTEKLLADVIVAISQTAGVVDGWMLAHRQTLEIVGTELANARDKVKPGERAWLADLSRVVRGMLAAAPAASGGEDGIRDAYEGAREDLLDWKGRALRAEATLRGLGYTGICADEAPQPPSAASVSERAQALFSAMLSAPYGDTTTGDIVCAETTRNRLESAWLPILEQALTQQRGEPEPIAWFSVSGYGGSLFVSEHKESVERWITEQNKDQDRRRVSPGYRHTGPFPLIDGRATPQPSADAVREDR